MLGVIDYGIRVDEGSEMDDETDMESWLGEWRRPTPDELVKISLGKWKP